MACDFGFKAVSIPQKHTFLSYSRYDDKMIAPIARLINEQRPIWYDEGLVAGKEWEKTIIEQVRCCKMALFFVSRDLLGRDGSYVCDEFRFVTAQGRPALCVRLDELSALAPSGVMGELWQGLSALPSVSVYDKPTAEEKAAAIIAAMDELFKKDPAVPDSHDLPANETNPTPKAEPKPEGGFAKFLGSKLFKAAVAIPVAAALAVGGTVAARHFLGNNDDISSYLRVEEIQSVDDIVEEDIVVMGEFEGKPIEWIVLDKKDDDVLLITKDVLCDKPFDDRYGSQKDGTYDNLDFTHTLFEHGESTVLSDTTAIYKTKLDVHWDNCSLRSWLNEDFAYNSFTQSELQIINYTTVTTPDFIFTPDKNFELLGTSVCDGGNDTKDYFFLLSENEYEKYFSSKNEFGWWLRSPGCGAQITIDNDYNPPHRLEDFWDHCVQIASSYNIDAHNLDNSRYISHVGLDFYVSCGVRPAMWVHIG